MNNNYCIIYNPVSGNGKSNYIAKHLQEDLNKRNKLNIKERQVAIRIGIHHGTVSKKATDYFGDDIERGYKKNLDPSQVALEMVPQDRSITLWKENKK